MKPSTLILAAWATDQLIGDPEWLPHPVRAIGQAISTGEHHLRRPNQTPTHQLALGTFLTATIVATTYYTTRTILQLTHRISPIAGELTKLALAATCLAARNLDQEAKQVLHVLETGNLPQARQRLARIVGRDTATLTEPEISRALIETLAESASDGILAPLFYLALGGVPLAMAYKAVNTLDSMIGHADARYIYFGKAAARLDDAANLIPARLTALALAAASASPADARRALTIEHRDAHLHKSPNAGHPEAAIAGALQARLGGPNTYAGELIPAPYLGAEFPPPTTRKARQAAKLVARATLLAVAATFLILRARERKPA